MSLDVHLEMREADAPQHDRIYVRRDGAVIEMSRDEWDELYPGREPVVVRANDDTGQVFWRNMTHNLGRMAGEAGLYDPLWQPTTTRAGDLIEPLREGLATLTADREHYEQFNPENGWGDYDLLASFTADYLAACERWPEAEVRVSR